MFEMTNMWNIFLMSYFNSINLRLFKCRISHQACHTVFQWKNGVELSEPLCSECCVQEQVAAPGRELRASMSLSGQDFR